MECCMFANISSWWSNSAEGPDFHSSQNFPVSINQIKEWGHLNSKLMVENVLLVEEFQKHVARIYHYSFILVVIKMDKLNLPPHPSRQSLQELHSLSGVPPCLHSSAEVIMKKMIEDDLFQSIMNFFMKYKYYLDIWYIFSTIWYYVLQYWTQICQPISTRNIIIWPTSKSKLWTKIEYEESYHCV
mgnify:CR=1 FL=1